MAFLLTFLFSYLAQAQAPAMDTCAPKVDRAKAILISKAPERAKFTYVEDALFGCSHMAKLSGRVEVRELLKKAVMGCEQIAAVRSLEENTDCYFRAVSAVSKLLK